MNFNPKLIFPTDDGDYTVKTDTDGQPILEKLDKEKKEEDLEELEEKDIKYVLGRNKNTGKPKMTLIVPSLRYLPLPAESWPNISNFFQNFLSSSDNTVNIYTMIDGRETTLSFTSPAQRQVVLRLMQSEMERRKANGEKDCLTVEALLYRYLAT